MSDHMPRCPNEVKIGNMVDQLRITGRYWKEQRRRHLQCVVRHSAKLKKELDDMEKTEQEVNAQIVDDDQNKDSSSETNKQDDNLTI